MVRRAKNENRDVAQVRVRDCPSDLSNYCHLDNEACNWVGQRDNELNSTLKCQHKAQNFIGSYLAVVDVKNSSLH